MNFKINCLVVGAFLMSAGCGDNLAGPEDPGDELARPDTYVFASRFVDGESAVAYSGQVFRQTLVAGLKAEIGAWTDRIDNSTVIQTKQEWLDELDFYFRFDSATSLDQPIELALDLPLRQAIWSDISSGANLIAKIAGEDDVTDYRDWDGDGEPVGAGGSMVGWVDGAPGSPVELIDFCFDTLATAAVDRAAAIPLDPFGDQIEHVYITPSGQDMRQIVQKFLLGALTFAQGTDDYLDSGTSGKGLDSPNARSDDDPFTTLGHAWDEGFGYFGARRDYNQYSDVLNASPGYADTNGDGMIDLTSELNSGMALNAAKRDGNSQASAQTDFSGAIFEALINGRHIIWVNAGAELSDADARALEAQRDVVVESWEKVFAATSIHYINETLAEMAETGTDDYSFTDHAKVWGELKGFSLAFQFNPRSLLSDADFAAFHALLGDAPVVTADQTALDDYAADLLAARDILETSFGFAGANVESW